MLSLYRTLGLRYLLKRWPRAVLAMASIALGVATWVTTGALNNSLLKAIHQMATPLGAFGDLFVSNGENGVSFDLRNELAGVPGVQTVRPLVFERVKLAVPPEGNLEPALLIGVELDLSAGSDKEAWGRKLQEDWGLTFSDGTFWRYGVARFKGQAPVVVGEELSKTLLLKDLDPFKVRAAGRSLELEQVGTLTAHGPAATLGGSVLAMDLNQAADLLGHPELVTRLDLSLAPGADRDAVRRAVQEVVGRRAEVQTPEERASGVREVIGGVEIGILVAGAGALLVGMFLVYNAMAVSVAERRHDIGILRSVGATRNQVRGLFVLETMVLGLVGTLLGLPMGRGLAYLLLGPMQRLMRTMLPVEVREVEVSWLLVATAVAAGMLTALLAALVPATQAASEEPADAVRRVPPSSGLVYRILQVGGAGAFFVAGSLLMAFKAYLPARTGTYAGFVLTGLGALLVTPILAAMIARVLQPLARRFLPLPARLAADNLVREPGRTGVVVAALASGVALMVETAGVFLSNKETVLEWTDRTVTADIIVTAGGPLSNSGSSLPMDDSVGDRIAQTFPGCRVSGIRFRYIPYRGTPIQLCVLDTRTYYEANTARGSTQPELLLYRRLAEEPDTALVSDNFASAHGVRPGDTITLPAAGGLVERHVIGTYEDPSWPRGTVLVNRVRKHGPGQLSRGLAVGCCPAPQFMTLHHTGDLDAGLVDYFDTYLPPGSDANEVRDQLQKTPWAAENALFAVTRAELRGHIETVLRGLSDLTFPQRFMVGVVAALGVVMALLISVLQRRRELGLLRAAGATRWQVLWAVLAEALLMGVIGIVIGVVVGIPVEWYVLRIVLMEETGFYFPLRIPWTDAAVIAGLSLLLAALAGLWPAIQATRLRIADVIAYE
jgi:putative ABC transport system permease protein